MTDYEAAYMDGYKAGMKFSNGYTDKIIVEQTNNKQIVEESDYGKLEREKDYWKECYGIAINHLKEIGNQYFIEHGHGFDYKK